MDQLRGVAVVTRVNHRVFGARSVEGLKTKLASWRENLEAVANFDALRSRLEDVGQYHHSIVTAKRRLIVQFRRYLVKNGLST